MTDMPKMTLDQAHEFLDFVNWRLLGWSTIDRIGHHGNSKAAKLADQRFRDLIGSLPNYDDFVAAAMAGTPIHELWPAEMQAEVERRINTLVPRAINVPTSPEFAVCLRNGRRTKWSLPDFLANHGRTPA